MTQSHGWTTIVHPIRMASNPHHSQKWISKKKKKLFSGSAVIKLFLKNVIFSRNYLFKLLKFKGITRKKYRNWWKPLLLNVNPQLQIRYPIIDNIFLSYNLMKPLITKHILIIKQFLTIFLFLYEIQ